MKSTPSYQVADQGVTRLVGQIALHCRHICILRKLSQPASLQSLIGHIRLDLTSCRVLRCRHGKNLFKHVCACRSTHAVHSMSGRTVTVMIPSKVTRKGIVHRRSWARTPRISRLVRIHIEQRQSPIAVLVHRQALEGNPRCSRLCVWHSEA